jgi:hypothetical protein
VVLEHEVEVTFQSRRINEESHNDMASYARATLPGHFFIQKKGYPLAMGNHVERAANKLAIWPSSLFTS